MLPKKRFFIAPAFLLLLLLAACNSKKPSSKEELSALINKRDQLNEKIAQLKSQLNVSDSTATATGRTIPVAVKTVQPHLFKDYIEIQGKVDAEKNVTVTSQVPGVVTHIYVESGDHVSAGQTLAQLDDNVVRQQLAQLETQLDYTKNIYERRKNLWDQNIGTQVELLTAKNNYENVNKQIKIVQSQLENYKIKSPISGVVDNVIIKIGQAASPGVPAFRVVNLHELKVTGQIGESHIAHIEKGDAVEIIFPDLNDTLHTHLTYVSNVIDPASRAFSVEIKLPHSSDFHPNMLAIIRVVSHINKDALTVPLSIIQKDQEGDYLYTVSNGKAIKKHVKVAEIYGGEAEISEGLQAGEKVVTAGYREVNNESPVTIK